MGVGLLECWHFQSGQQFFITAFLQDSSTVVTTPSEGCQCPLVAGQWHYRWRRRQTNVSWVNAHRCQDLDSAGVFWLTYQQRWQIHTPHILLLNDDLVPIPTLPFQPWKSSLLSMYHSKNFANEWWAIWRFKIVDFGAFHSRADSRCVNIPIEWCSQLDG